jgi:hypothetical protein
MSSPGVAEWFKSIHFLSEYEKYDNPKLFSLCVGCISVLL